ncbi:MAG: hypothetical protein JW910_14730 [Anaerolineae bacterium]|nr:hypothetical protein [Anaerolineae bacterium]
MKFKLFVLVLLVAVSASPALAQGGPTHSVSFDGVGFSFDATLADNVNIWQYPADPVDLQAPGGPQVGHTLFMLYSGEMAPSAWEAAAGVYVFRTADFAGYTYYEERLAQLQALLAERPDLASYMVVADNMSGNTLPFLPVLPAGQIIRARAQYVDTAEVSGISFVTAYRQDAFPFMRGDFYYTFQGLSTDGAYYVSLMARLDAGMFPAEIGVDFDYDAFINTITAYMNDSIAQLNAASPADFTPSLAMLDALVQTFAFEG